LGAINRLLDECWKLLEERLPNDQLALVRTWKDLIYGDDDGSWPPWRDDKWQTASVPYDFSVGNLPKVAEKIKTGGSNPGGGFLIASRELKKGNLKNGNQFYVDVKLTKELTAAQLSKLAKDPESLKTLILADTTWKNVSKKYQFGTVWQCVQTLYGYNVKQQKAFLKTKPKEGPLNSVRLGIGGIGYNECPYWDKEVASIIKSLK
ncbi:MAG: hypothetical protein FWG47_00305, partial [Propionibacteriaceae bacterium]|nr:hypothetical protein [Propionibacteriaceae bacterium]